MVATTPHTRKAKGRVLSQKVRNDVVERLKIDTDDIKVTPSSVTGCDLWLGKTARKKFPFGVECKNREMINIWAAIEQCETNARKEELIPLLIFKRNRSSIYAVVEWESLLNLIHRPPFYYRNRGDK